MPAGLELRDTPASASRVLGLKAFTTTARPHSSSAAVWVAAGPRLGCRAHTWNARFPRWSPRADYKPGLSHGTPNHWAQRQGLIRTRARALRVPSHHTIRFRGRRQISLQARPARACAALVSASLGSARPRRRRRRRRRRIPNKERSLRPPPPPPAAAPVTAGRQSRPVWAQDLRPWRSNTADLRHLLPLSMATPDVSVHMEEVVVVTTPDTAVDGSGVEEVKTVLVTTNLAPHGGDLTEDNMETENAAAAAAAAFTASSQLKEAVLVKMAEEGENLEAEIVYPITCGDSRANLIWRKFVCPGINVKCVQYDEHVISPKEFVHLAGKSTLKDWKRAIRMNGIMLRKIMDSGELDFYQHDKVCSNTCRSTKIDLSGARVSLSSPTSTEYIPLTPAAADVNGSPATITIETCEDPGDWTTAIGDDTFAFWRGLKDAGLLDEVIQEFQQELEETMKGLQQRVQDPPLQLRDAVLLNNIVQNFGMLDLVKKVLASHKCQMDRSREQYARDLAALEQQCDEHRRRAKELKHKSQHLSNVLMTLTPVSLPSPMKRPRLARATSGPAAMASQVLTQSAQIALGPGMPVSQLTSMPLSKVVSTLPSTVLGKGSPQAAPASSPASPLLGGYTVLASSGSTFPSTVEIHPDTSSLTVLSTAAMQDGSTVLKVVSPLQLLTLPGLGPTLQNVAQASPAGSTIMTVPTVAATGPEEHTATIEVAAVADDHEQK